MAFWYTYSSDDDRHDSENETLLPQETFEEFCEKISAENEIIDHFFQEVSQVPFLYRFKQRTHPTLEEWTSPTNLHEPEKHFEGLVDDATMRSIQIGIDRSPTYRVYDMRKKHSLTRSQLVTVFDLAAKWMVLTNMGRNNYINELCWVASRILHFQWSTRSFTKQL